jgi:hypothetical protein
MGQGAWWSSKVMVALERLRRTVSKERLFIANRVIA